MWWRRSPSCWHDSFVRMLLGMVLVVEKLVQASTVQNTKNCKAHPGKCLSQVFLDGAIIAAVYVALAVLIDKNTPSLDAVVSFLSIWTPMLYTFKALDLEYSDQMARVGGFQLATKVFGLLTM